MSGEVKLTSPWWHPLSTFGLALIAASTILYSYGEASLRFLTPETTGHLLVAAGAYLVTMAIGVVAVMLDVRRGLFSRAARARESGSVPLTPGWVVPYVLSLRRYRRYFLIGTLLYGVLYAFVTSMIVYQPGVDFVSAYGAAIPSVLVSTCCGAPLTLPAATVYVVNHLGLLLIPSEVLLLLLVAPLVGLNLALVIFVYDHRTPGPRRYWLGGLGAAVGLFTGCPTCAGIFFASTIGGTGAASFATLLALYQPEFIATSLPLLVATIFMASRGLSRVFREGCILLPQNGQLRDET